MFRNKSKQSKWIILSMIAISIVLYLQMSIPSLYDFSPQTIVILDQSSVKKCLPDPGLSNESLTEEEPVYIDTINVMRSSIGGKDVVEPLASSPGSLEYVAETEALSRWYQEAGSTLKKGTVPRKIILWTSWRSGSTFLGDLLAKAVPDQTFYSFEPLYGFGVQVLSDPELNTTKAALRLTRDLLQCNLAQHQDFVKSNADLHFPLAANPFFQHRCAKIDKCGDPVTFSETCDSADLHVAKIVRLSLKLAREFLQDPDMEDLQIVYLVRDPRPVMRSRYKSGNRRWCQPNSQDCSNHNNLCRLLEDDLQQVPQLLEDFPDRFFFLKYEDLSLNSSGVIRQLWDSLHIPLTSSFVDYLNKTTRGERPQEQRIDSSRQTLQHTFEWRNTIEWPLVVDVQTSCSCVIKNLGWRVFSTEDELRNPSLSMFIEELANNSLKTN